MEPVASPLSNCAPRRVRDLPAAFIRSALHDYYAEAPPAGVCDTDYSLWECQETGLQFAVPPLQGNAAFYRWVGQFASYYPGLRWDYTKVREIVAGLPSWQGPLLDVGAGRGDFLAYFDLLAPGLKLGIDLNADAVQDCAKRGFGAFCGTVDEAVSSGFVKPGGCGIVTAFHVLEHVEDPVGFAASLVSLAEPSGRVFLSTPNSPMSFEGRWFDILNHPPHHLTRWNPRAYAKLASILGCRIRMFHPPSSVLRDTFKLFQLLRHGTKTLSRAGKIKDALFHPATFARCFAAQLEHRRQHPPPHSDVILVELTKE